VVIRDELHEILELSPSVPKLHGLISLLRGKEYDELEEVQDHASNPDVRVFFLMAQSGVIRLIKRISNRTTILTRMPRPTCRLVTRN